MSVHVLAFSFYFQDPDALLHGLLPTLFNFEIEINFVTAIFPGNHPQYFALIAVPSCHFQASRKHYCTNGHVSMKENVDEEW